MPTDFVETGQTFTQDGAPFCPVERKRRGAAAFAASLSVLAAGAGFLTYAMVADPLQASSKPAQIAKIEPTAQELKLASAPAQAAPEAGAQAPALRTSVETPQTVTPASAKVEDAIAQSRAARREGQDAIAIAIRSENGDLAPAKKQDLKPRVKPISKSSNLDPIQTASFTALVRPAAINAAMLAADDIAPTPFFFAADLQPAQYTPQLASVDFTGDINRDMEERFVRIKKGENFVDALKRAGVTAQGANTAAYAFGKHYNLRRLRPGQEFALTVGWENQTLFQLASANEDPPARLVALDFRADDETRIHLRRDASGAMKGEKAKIDLTTRLLSFDGEIQGSLYLSAKAQGAPDEIIANLADAFAYDVDFQREIFGGDEFEAIYEARYDDEGARVASGEIIFARLNWRGRQREKGYYRFDDDGDGRADFYDTNGQSAKRLLMKTPIDGARLSSGFGRRKHPVLGYKRAHKGVDFAARRGTPIKAAGDGVVERADRYGSFGNYVRIRHANGYKTAYAHLKGFRRGIRKGKRVRQGDIIGYVGTTGRSTGPHLHYEVHLKGKPVNPQRLKIATGKKLTGDTLSRFTAQRDAIDALRAPPPQAVAKKAVMASKIPAAKGSP